MKTKSAACVAAVMMIASVLPTGCASVSSAPRESLQIYQPRSLRLSAGIPVQTKDGIYRPQVDELWHSAAAYAQLEQEAINLAAALAQERNRK
jgi:hypothetical protein